MDISILGWLFIVIFLSGGVGWIIGRENMIDGTETVRMDTENVRDFEEIRSRGSRLTGVGSSFFALNMDICRENW